MRHIVLVFFTPLLACGSATQNTSHLPDAGPPGGDLLDADSSALADGGSDASPPPPALQIITPNVDVNPGVEKNYCYYFHTPNTIDLAIQQWSSHMTAGVHDMTFYLTTNDHQPPGTLSDSVCGIVSSLGWTWTYSAQTPDAEVHLPPDDGNGHPVAQVITAGHSGFLIMHVVNTTSDVIHTHVELDAYAYERHAQITPAAPFVAFYLNTSQQPILGPGSPTNPATGTVGGSCSLSMDNGKVPNFFMVTTHTHKQGIHTFVKDGSTTVFDGTNWEHPGSASRDAAPFFVFSSSQWTYQCEYSNPNAYSILIGDDPVMDEICMAIGLYFPSASESGHLCLNSAIVY